MKKIVTLSLLFLILLIGSFINFMPHSNYNYPLHVDEWTHFTNSKHISNGSPLYFGGESNSLEEGFHILLAVLNLLGVPYLFMFKFLPFIITFFLGMITFILVRKWFDDISALFSVVFIMMLKSSVSLLGPMFLVPMALGLMFIFIGLYLIKSKLLFLIIATTLIIHPPSGIALLILINSYVLGKYIKNKKIKFSLLLQQVVGILISLPLFLGQLLMKGAYNLQFSESIIPFYFIPRYLSYIITGIILIGIFIIIYRKKYTLFIYPLILLILAVLYYQYQINVLIFYERNLMYLLAFFAIPFGIAIGTFSNAFKKFKSILAVIIIVLLLIFLMPQKIESTKNVYKIINDSEYDEFLSYKELEGTRAVLDPWKAIAFTSIAEKEIYSRIPPGPIEQYLARNEEIFNFFNNNCVNETFLKQNEIDIVVGC